MSAELRPRGGETHASAPAGSTAALTAAAVVCGACLAYPFWMSRYLPLLDLPQHLAIATVIDGSAEAGSTFAREFQVQWGELTPYWLYYAVVALIAKVVGVETASRLYLTGYALAFPWAGIALCRAFGRSGWLGLLAAPLALNTNLYYGFVNYCAAVVLLLFGIAAIERRLQSSSGAVALAVLSVVLFFAHVQVFAFFLLCAALLALVHEGAPSARAKAAALLPLAPATLLLFAPWVFLTFFRTPSTPGQLAPLGDARPAFLTFEGNVHGFPTAIAGAFRDASDLRLLAAWMLVLVGALAAGLATRADQGPALHRGRVALLVLAALAGYFLAPMSIRGQWNINPRFAVLAALLAVPAALPSRRGALALGAAAVALTGVTGVNAAVHHRAFDREAGPFEKALAAMPKGGRALSLIFEPKGALIETSPYLHFGQYYTVRRGGACANSFAASAALPVRYRDHTSFPTPNAWRPGDFRWDVHGDRYDVFLVRGRPPGPDVFSAVSDRVRLVYEGGEWRVFRRVSP
jgi:hypothetical protein